MPAHPLIPFLRSTKRTLSVYVLLSVLGPATKEQIAAALAIQPRTAKEYCAELARLDPPLVGLAGDLYTALPASGFPLLSTDSIHNLSTGYPQDDARFAHEPARNAHEMRETRAPRDSSTDSTLTDAPLKLERKIDSNPQNQNLSDSLTNLTASHARNAPDPAEDLDPESLSYYREMLSIGVYQSVALDILGKFTAEQIQQYLDYYAYAHDNGIARTSGWFVRAIRYLIPPPPGFLAASRAKNPASKYVTDGVIY